MTFAEFLQLLHDPIALAAVAGVLLGAVFGKYVKPVFIAILARLSGKATTDEKPKCETVNYATKEDFDKMCKQNDKEHKALEGKVDNIFTILDEIRKKLNGIEVNFATFGNEQKNIANNVDKLEKRVNELGDKK